MPGNGINQSSHPLLRTRLALFKQQKVWEIENVAMQGNGNRKLGLNRITTIQVLKKQRLLPA
jgi:hypothetical protein